MQYKTTNKLFNGVHQYKAVLVVPAAGLFRGNNLDRTLTQLGLINLDTQQSALYRFYKRSEVKSPADLSYAISLVNLLKKFDDVDLRVESPWISIYCNNKKLIDGLVKLDKERIKYISVPPDSTVLDAGVIVMPKIDFEYRVTLGKTDRENSAFIEWAQTNKNVKLTKSCTRELKKTLSWGGSYFYITGDKNLTLARMHLGGSINKVERIVKS